MKTLIIVSSVVLGLSGCATCNTPLTNLTLENQLQENHVTRIGTDRKIQVTMANGEVLAGTLRDVDIPINRKLGDNLMTGVVVGDGGGAYAFLFRHTERQQQVHAVLRSTTTESTLEIEVIGVYHKDYRHGFGQARSNDGRHYELQFEML
jgi:small nuclear ribonucleoprotein (snRNP)-like protein